MNHHCNTAALAILNSSSQSGNDLVGGCHWRLARQCRKTRFLYSWFYLVLAFWNTPAFAQLNSINEPPALEAQEASARSVLDALNAVAFASRFERVSIPVEEVTANLSLLGQPKESSKKDSGRTTPPRDPQADEQSDPPETQSNPPPFESLAIKRISFENMEVVLGERKSGGELELIFSVLGQSQDEPRIVENYDDHPGENMHVFEPALLFDKSAEGLITVDLELFWQPASAWGKNKRPFNQSSKPISVRPIKVEARVLIRDALIPLDVYFDSEQYGITPIPQRRINEFKAGSIDVEIRKVGMVKLPAPLRRELTKLIRRQFGDVISTEVYKAVASFAASR